jgi:hypothetical protein
VTYLHSENAQNKANRGKNKKKKIGNAAVEDCEVSKEKIFTEWFRLKKFKLKLGDMEKCVFLS